MNEPEKGLTIRRIIFALLGLGLLLATFQPWVNVPYMTLHHEVAVTWDRNPISKMLGGDNEYDWIVLGMIAASLIAFLSGIYVKHTTKGAILAGVLTLICEGAFISEIDSDPFYSAYAESVTYYPIIIVIAIIGLTLIFLGVVFQVMDSWNRKPARY